MDPDREDFSLYGPSHITILDWENEHHQRCITSCLIQGVYILERNRQLKREGSKALGYPWWEYFSFKLIQLLIDSADSSIFGGIFEFGKTIASGVPQYIIAFRGTYTKPDTISRDLQLDVEIIRNKLHDTSRYKIAMEAVVNMLTTSANNPSNIWLTGHSMGAAIALLAGKTLAKDGIYIKSLLFNPPFLSPQIGSIENESLRNGIRILGTVATAALAFWRALKQTPEQQQLLLQNILAANPLASWLPDIHINPGDLLCSEYSGFFEHRGKMEENGVGIVDKMAMNFSLPGLVTEVFGVHGVVETEEPVHVIPSANLILNRTVSGSFLEAHGIHQWWTNDQDLVTNTYSFR